MRKILISGLLLLTMATPVLAKSEIYYNKQWIYDRNINAWTYYINNEKIQGVNFVDGKEYCFDNMGNLVNGWVKLDNNWLYTDRQGIVQHGWVKKNGNWYFFNPLGYMEKDTVIDGYKINSDGIWVQ